MKMLFPSQDHLMKLIHQANSCLHCFLHFVITKTYQRKGVQPTLLCTKLRKLWKFWWSWLPWVGLLARTFAWMSSWSNTGNQVCSVHAAEVNQAWNQHFQCCLFRDWVFACLHELLWEGAQVQQCWTWLMSFFFQPTRNSMMGDCCMLTTTTQQLTWPSSWWKSKVGALLEPST